MDAEKIRRVEENVGADTVEEQQPPALEPVGDGEEVDNKDKTPAEIDAMLNAPGVQEALVRESKNSPVISTLWRWLTRPDSPEFRRMNRDGQMRVLNALIELHEEKIKKLQTDTLNAKKNLNDKFKDIMERSDKCEARAVELDAREKALREDFSVAHNRTILWQDLEPEFYALLEIIEYLAPWARFNGSHRTLWKQKPTPGQRRKQLDLQKNEKPDGLDQKQRDAAKLELEDDDEEDEEAVATVDENGNPLSGEQIELNKIRKEEELRLKRQEALGTGAEEVHLLIYKAFSPISPRCRELGKELAVCRGVLAALMAVIKCGASTLIPQAEPNEILHEEFYDKAFALTVALGAVITKVTSILTSDEKIRENLSLEIQGSRRSRRADYYNPNAEIDYYWTCDGIIAELDDRIDFLKTYFTTMKGICSLSTSLELNSSYKAELNFIARGIASTDHEARVRHSGEKALTAAKANERTKENTTAGYERGVDVYQRNLAKQAKVAKKAGK